MDCTYAARSVNRFDSFTICTYNKFTPLEAIDIDENEISAKNSNSSKCWNVPKVVNFAHNVKNKSYCRNINSDSVKDKSSYNISCGSKNKLSCMYFNARSIVNKVDELEIYVKEEELDIIGISETWLTEEILTSEISLEGYTLYRKDRKDLVKTRGGGVALYVKNEINIIEREDINAQLFPESLWCELLFKGEKTLLGICYRPPDSLTVNNEALYSLINKVGKENVVIMGDFNFPEIGWDSSSNTLHEHPFITCLNDNFLEQLVDKPTRGENILDLVLCSDISFVQNLTVGEPFGTSDHQIIRFDLVVSKESAKDDNVSIQLF